MYTLKSFTYDNIDGQIYPGTVGVRGSAQIDFGGSGTQGTHESSEMEIPLAFGSLIKGSKKKSTPDKAKGE